MDDEYSIATIILGDGVRACVLTRSGEDDFLTDLASTGKTRNRAVLIARMAARVARNGTDWAVAAKKLKPVSRDVSMFELRIDRRVIRVMAYIHDDPAHTPVYLFDFDGHQGKSGKIDRNLIKKGERLAAIAAKCMEVRK